MHQTAIQYLIAFIFISLVHLSFIYFNYTFATNEARNRKLKVEKIKKKKIRKHKKKKIGGSDTTRESISIVDIERYLSNYDGSQNTSSFSQKTQDIISYIEKIQFYLSPKFNKYINENVKKENEQIKLLFSGIENRDEIINYVLDRLKTIPALDRYKQNLKDDIINRIETVPRKIYNEPTPSSASPEGPSLYSSPAESPGSPSKPMPRIIKIENLGPVKKRHTQISPAELKIYFDDVLSNYYKYDEELVKKYSYAYENFNSANKEIADFILFIQTWVTDKDDNENDYLKTYNQIWKDKNRLWLPPDIIIREIHVPLTTLIKERLLLITQYKTIINKPVLAEKIKEIINSIDDQLKLYRRINEIHEISPAELKMYFDDVLSNYYKYDKELVKKYSRAHENFNSVNKEIVDFVEFMQLWFIDKDDNENDYLKTYNQILKDKNGLWLPTDIIIKEIHAPLANLIKERLLLITQQQSIINKPVLAEKIKEIINDIDIFYSDERL